MIELGLLTGKRFVLDLGCGNGMDSDFFKGIGYEVTSVDSNTAYKGAIKADIKDFNIETGKYGVIICNNVLPFITDREVVKEIIIRISKGLADKGVAALSVFGQKDDWTSKKNMSFFAPEEISAYLDSIGVNVIEKVVTEGYGKTMNGEVKYWEVIRFLFSKQSISLTPHP